MKKKVLFLMTDFGFTRFFHKIIEKLLAEGHEIQISPTIPINAESKTYNVQQCRWDNFDFEPITKFNPDTIIVFNGYHPSIMGAVAVLKHKYNVFHSETGWLPQYQRSYIDTDMGYGGEISKGFEYRKPKAGLSYNQEQIINKLKEHYTPKAPDIDLPENFILIPLQLEHDVSILKDSPYMRLMRSLVGFVLENTKGIPIIVRQHPLGLGRIKFNSWNRIPKDSRVRVIYSNENKVSTNDLAAKATMIVGLNSTSLMEALIHYKPIIQFANNMIGTTNEKILSNPSLLEDYKKRILSGEKIVNVDLYNEKILYLYANQFDLEEPCPEWVYKKIINYTTEPRNMENLLL